MEGFVLAVHVGDELLAGGNEDFLAVVVHLHERIVGEFHEILADAQFAEFIVNDLEANHFVEIEAVAGEFGEAAERQVEFRLHKLLHIAHIHILQFDDKLVVASILQIFDHIGQHLAVGFDEDGVKVEVAFAIIDIKKGAQLAFQSERFC